MGAKEGFEVALTSRDEVWPRYNVTLLCGAFDGAGARTGFFAADSHIADVGAADAAERMAAAEPHRTVRLRTDPCDHILLYIYMVPHTLPAERDIEATRPFEVELRVACDGRPVRRERLRVNPWSGASIELKIGRE